ncbi:SAM-dependent methyltransferase [Streptomyces sp. BH105]|uniref:SAM-dependent methyltransferase n=1 Tax=Streptomyces sp. BH105 TaxID=3410408 RepID=UPI003CE79A8E
MEWRRGTATPVHPGDTHGHSRRPAHLYNTSDNPRTNRTPEQKVRFFAGLELVEPGPTSDSPWRPEGGEGELPKPVSSFGGIGRKPWCASTRQLPYRKR